MDAVDYFILFVLIVDAFALSGVLGWYLADDIRKVPYRRSLTRDPRVFDPHVLINGRWVRKDVPHWACLPYSEQRAWFELRR